VGCDRVRSSLRDTEIDLEDDSVLVVRAARKSRLWERGALANDLSGEDISNAPGR